MVVTLKELARLAGVHPSTVSRVLNAEAGVRLSAATRERVFELARETGYRPNHTARSLKRRQTLVIGVLIPDISNPLFASMFRGVEDAAFARGYNALLCSTDDRPGRLDRHVRLLSERQVDGLILATARCHDETVAWLRERDEAFVLLNRRTAEHAERYVVGDDFGGAELATRHLLAVGCRRVAHLAGPDSVMTGQLRRRGYRRALEADGLGEDPALVAECDFTEAGGYRATRGLLERAPQPDGIFAVNDMAALGALDALDERGLDVPGDVALVGFNDVPLAARVSPALTTVRVPIYAMGAAAAEMLIDLLGDRAAPAAGRVLESRLIVRASTQRKQAVGAGLPPTQGGRFPDD